MKASGRASGAAGGPDRDQAGYWTGINAGDYVCLSDAQSFAEAGTGGLDYLVREVKRIVVGEAGGAPSARGPGDQGPEGLVAYHLHELEREGSGSLYLLVVTAGGDFELRVYFAPAGFATGSRDRLVDLGQTWLFLPPADPEDFLSSELEYAPFPDLPPVPEAGVAVKRQYAMAGFGKPVYGSYPGKGGQIPAILVEYSCEDGDAPNPLVLVLEEGWMDSEGRILDEGGLVTTLLGCRVQGGSVEIYPSVSTAPSGRRSRP